MQKWYRKYVLATWVVVDVRNLLYLIPSFASIVTTTAFTTTVPDVQQGIFPTAIPIIYALSAVSRCINERIKERR